MAAEWGFTCGDDPDDDVPKRMEIIVHRTSNLVFQILSMKDMFPSGSRLKTVVAQCNGNGYKALKQIIFKSHPCYHVSPSTLITAYPRQREQSMTEYHNNFVDYQQLRAYISDIVKDLSDDGELEIFINNCKHSEFLQRVTRDERRVAALQYKYRGHQLVETLESYLMAPDSPARRDTMNETRAPNRTSIPAPTRRFTPSSSPNRGITPSRAPIATRVNDIHITASDETPPMEPTDSNESAPEDANDFDYAVADVCGIEVPEGQWETYDQYRVAVNSIRRNPELADSPNCIVCGDNHRFAQCPILNNADFLRQHYIRYCQLCNRDRQLREASSQAPNPQRNNARVNVLDVDEFDALMRDDVDRDIENFQNGRS